MKTMKNILLIPYPAQGHVTPMLKLASVLSTFGFKLTIIVPDFINCRILTQINQNDVISFLSIPDGLDKETPKDFFSIEMAMEKNMPLYLEQIVLKMEEYERDGIACLVVDLLASWAFDVGRRCGIPVVGFWPAMHACYRLISAIPHLIREGFISENGCPIRQNESICFSPGDPCLTTNDLPWLIGSSKARISRFKFWTRTFQRSKTLKCILTNTFPNESGHQLFKQVTSNDSGTHKQVVEIMPLIMQTSTINNTASFREEDTTCLKWLDNQDVGSVVYVSFGSWVSPIGDAKVNSLALALEASKKPFLWVLASAWRHGLPDGYIEKMTQQGRVVSWAPQMEVLQHQAVGCYLTHCGWNSTLEGIQCRKPFLCYPIAGDQFVNCAYIVNVWKIGVRLEGFGSEEVEEGIRKVFEDEEMGRRIEKMNEEVFGKEGSSQAMSNLLSFIRDFSK